MSTSMQRSVALVTGAAYGIGAATAKTLAREGYALVLCDLTSDMVAETAEAVTAVGASAHAVALDLRDDDSIAAALAETVEALGRLDLLVNNAGVSSLTSGIELERAELSKVVDVNLTGTFCITRAAGRHWIDTRAPGAVVSVTSTHGIRGGAGGLAYGVTKAAVAHMTRMLAIEWAPHGIRVNAVAPGSTVTPTRKALSDPEKRGKLLERFPLGRFGEPEDIAEAIAYLGGPRAGFITGHVLVLDGGLTVK